MPQPAPRQTERKYLYVLWSDKEKDYFRSVVDVTAFDNLFWAKHTQKVHPKPKYRIIKFVPEVVK